MSGHAASDYDHWDELSQAYPEKQCLEVKGNSFQVEPQTIETDQIYQDQIQISKLKNFFRSGLSSTPTNGKVFYNYGNYLRDQERKEEAALCYKEALR